MGRILKTNNAKLWIFTIALTLFYGFTFIFSEFYGSPFDGIKDFCILAMQWGVVLIGSAGLLYTLVLNKYVFAIFFPLITVLCTILTYFRYTLQVALTPMIIDLALINDARTCLDIVSLQLIIWVILALIFSVLCIYYRWKYIKIDMWYFHIIISLSLIMLTNVWVYRFVRPVTERMPYSIYYNICRYLEEKKVVSENRNTFNNSNTICYGDSLVVVFVLGESLRYDHLQINGYERNTTPTLAKNNSVVSFPNIYTEAYYTHTSVPHILTRADSIYPERAYTEQSFITLFNQAGYRTAWIANQESVDTYVYFMNECDTLIYANRGQSLYKFDKWLDGDLLPYYSDELKRNDNRKFILLHTIGSHWWYNARYPDSFEQYKPVIKSRVVSACTREEMVNSYDNTVLYTDYVIGKLIDELKNKKAVLFFLSDHGEALGEDGNYLHAEDFPASHRPACFVWYSSSYANQYPEKIRSLNDNRMKYYRTDFMFHSILDAADIESKYINKDFSILHD